MLYQGKITDVFSYDTCVYTLIEPELNDKIRNRILMANSVIKTNGLNVTFTLFNPTKKTTSNSSAAFERLMEVIHFELQLERCLAYLSNTIAFGSTFKVTMENLSFRQIKTRKFKNQAKEMRFIPVTIVIPRTHCIPRQQSM